MPRRIQRSRARGWRKPTGAVIVSRPGRWGNPIKLRQTSTGTWVVSDIDGLSDTFCSQAAAARLAVKEFERRLFDGELPFTVDDVRRELSGKDLCCWCAEDAAHCHADVLLRVANETNRNGVTQNEANREGPRARQERDRSAASVRQRRARAT